MVVTISRSNKRVAGMTDSTHSSSRSERIGISQATRALTLGEDLQAYGAAGCRVLGVWLHKLERGTMPEFWFPRPRLAPEVVEAAADAIESAGFVVSHVIMAGRFTEYDEDVRRRRIEYAVSAARVAHQLRARCLVMIPGRLNGLSPARATEFAAKALTEVVDSYGDVPLAIEPVTEVDFANTLDGRSTWSTSSITRSWGSIPTRFISGAILASTTRSHVQRGESSASTSQTPRGSRGTERAFRPEKGLSRSRSSSLP